MNKNYLTQVVILFLLTIGILLGLSMLKPTDINFTTRQIDLLSSLRNKPVVDESDEEIEDIAATDSVSNLVSDSTISRTHTDSVPLRPTIKAPRKAGDITLIEDYTMAQAGMQHFATAIYNRNNLQRPVRIGVLGDSFIEADILTQNIRQLLQDIYGGSGVGYMAMHSDFPGFRRSIAQVDKGWETYNVASNAQLPYTSLTLQLHRPQGDGKTYTRYKGVKKLRHINEWEVSKVGFIADTTAVISLKTDSTLHTFDIAPDSEAQFIVIAEPTHSLEVECNQAAVAFWGTWLDGTTGIAVDNISIRGYSGTTLQSIPAERLQQLNNAIPYDLILLQYGLNRMTPSITDYSSYTTQLVEAINHLRSALPHTDIVIVGIGDRSQNENGSLQTMKAVYGIRKAQRNAAIEAQCHFWDCYEAMKTLGGMPTFVENSWANKDYTHINHAGGSPLANEFVKAIKYALEKNTTAHIPQSQPDTLIYE